MDEELQSSAYIDHHCYLFSVRMPPYLEGAQVASTPLGTNSKPLFRCSAINGCTRSCALIHVWRVGAQFVHQAPNASRHIIWCIWHSRLWLRGTGIGVPA